MSQHPETMIFKSQLKTTRSRPLLRPHSSFPSTKPLLELVQGIIKIQSEAKSTALPPGISANQQRGKKDRNHRKSVFSKVQTPPPGEIKFGTDEGRMKEANKEKGDRMSTFPVEAAVATWTQAPCTGHTQVLDRQTTTTSRYCTMSIHSRRRSKHLLMASEEPRSPHQCCQSKQAHLPAQMSLTSHSYMN